MSEARSDVALVVAAHGRRGILESGGLRRAFIVKGRRLHVVCGDHVRFQEPRGSEVLLVTAIEPRKNALARVRPSSRGAEIIAANVTQMITVCAPLPEPDFFLVDRYLCAAELMACRQVIVWNKCDLRAASAVRAEYAQLCLQIIEVSTRTGVGFAALRDLLEGQVSVLVGQSGVGKSSLVNALVPGSSAAVGELSGTLALGTHTTTAALMYRIGHSGRLLDTPGVRDFVPAMERRSRVALGFREFTGPAAHCRFADCQHDHEPDCAVKAALDNGQIARRRYVSYLRLHSVAADTPHSGE